MSLLADVSKVLHDNQKFIWLMLFVFLPLLYVLSGFYSIGPEQRGILSRFGKILDDQVSPGMHYHLPWPIEQIEKIQATSVRSMELDMVNTRDKTIQKELTTGDQNLLEVKLTLQYTIEEPGIFQNQSINPEQLLRELASSEVIHYLASKPINALLTTGRIGLQTHLKDSIQYQARNLNLGIRINAIQIKTLQPPSSIKKNFDQAAIAKSEKRKMIQEQQALRNSKLATARAEANSSRQSTKAKVSEITEKAQGDYANFLSNLKEYRKNPELVLQQSHLNTLNDLFDRAKLIVIPSSGREAR